MFAIDEERLHLIHLASVFTRSLNEQIDRVWQSGQDTFETFLDGSGATRQIDDQSTPARTGDATRKHTEGRVAQTFGTHGLGNTGGLAVDYRARSLRRDIAGSQAGAAGSQDQVEMLLVAPFA